MHYLEQALKQMGQQHAEQTMYKNTTKPKENHTALFCQSPKIKKIIIIKKQLGGSTLLSKEFLFSFLFLVILSAILLCSWISFSPLHFLHPLVKLFVSWILQAILP